MGRKESNQTNNKFVANGGKGLNLFFSKLNFMLFYQILTPVWLNSDTFSFANSADPNQLADLDLHCFENNSDPLCFHSFC